MKLIKAIIIEDELRTISALKNLLKKHCENVFICATATNASDAIGLIKKHEPDLVFLDIVMPGISGLELLESFRNPPDFMVVFVTAHEQYAAAAFRHAAVDYLVKPIRIGELKEAVQKAADRDKNQTFIKELAMAAKEMQADKQHLVLTQLKETIYLLKNEIVYCESEGSYTKFFREDKDPVYVSKGLHNYEPELTENFIRVHKSYLVNIHYVTKMITKDNNIPELVMTTGERITVGKVYLKEVKKALSVF
jgi:two-component system, LytTR family, response regulator